MDQVGLRFRRPDRAAGAPAVPISRPVKHDDAILLGGLVEQPARLEILDHAAVAVQQDERLAFSTLDVVQPDCIDLEEPPLWWIEALGGLRKPSVYQRRDSERSETDRCCGRVWVISKVRQRLACAGPRRHQATL